MLDTNKERKSVLTPCRKHLGKAVARRSQKTIAVENMKYPSTQHVLVKLFGKEVRKEVRSMASVISIKLVKDLVTLTLNQIQIIPIELYLQLQRKSMIHQTPLMKVREFYWSQTHFILQHSP